MYTDIWHQLFLFFVFFVMGAVFALVYDTFRVSGRFVPRKTVFTVFGDILFWLTATVVMFGVCLKFNDGEIRFFMFLGMLCGALLYFNTLSRFVIFVLGFVADLLKRFVVCLLKILFIPLKLLNKPVFIALSVTKNNAVKILKKIKFKLKVFIKFKR